MSSTIGLRKPEAEAYDYVVRAIGVSANRIVFFDDTVENIEGARARGLQAVHVKSGADWPMRSLSCLNEAAAVEERSRSSPPTRRRALRRGLDRPRITL